MDKNDFIGLLNRYADTSAEEAAEIASLKAEFPYSQLLQTLSARVSKDHAFKEYEQELARAAVSAADRAILKAIITAQEPTDLSGKLSPEKVAIVTPLPAREEEEATADDAVIDYADEVMRDLKKLNDLKTNFEMLLVEYSEVKASGVQAKPSIKEEPKSDQQTAHAAPRGEKGKSKKQRIIELAQRLNSESGSASDEGRSSGKKTGRRAQYPEGLIEEIKTSKKELKPESEKQKEQINIINNFIKTQPSISNSKEKVILPPGDLNPVRSGEFGDNIVSETLVEILVKQGKKDKAIEVLKKLIWKYPQKKSYFASQIEDLKK